MYLRIQEELLVKQAAMGSERVSKSNMSFTSSRGAILSTSLTKWKALLNPSINLIFTVTLSPGAAKKKYASFQNV